MKLFEYLRKLRNKYYGIEHTQKKMPFKNVESSVGVPTREKDPPEKKFDKTKK